MKQVFFNLLTNAVQASPPGETVVITSVSEDGKILINITDHGPGIAAEQKENIFTPFFTTKKKGVGLGLVMVKNIVAAHGGVTVLAIRRDSQMLPNPELDMQLLANDLLIVMGTQDNLSNSNWLFKNPERT